MGLRFPHPLVGGSLALAGLLCLAATTPAQDLEPRAFSPAPTGLNFGVLAYGHSTGNVFFDPVLPIEGASGTVQSATLAYVRTLSFFGAGAKLSAIVPYAWGTWNGVVDGTYRSRIADGFADPGIQLSVNVVGAPAFSLREMVSYREGTIVGASVLVKFPLGQYDPDRLINLGTHRWTLVSRLGVTHRLEGWTFEAIGSASFYTDNDDAYQDTRLSQEPLWGLVVDVIYQFDSGIWFGFGAGMGTGARTAVDGIPKDTYQKNTRVGGVVVYPLNRHTSLKATFVHSIGTARGADFDTLALAYQVRWGGGL